MTAAATERRGGVSAAPGSPRWLTLLQGIKTRALTAMQAEGVRRGDPLRTTVESMVDVPLAFGEAMAELAAEMKGTTDAAAGRIELAAGEVRQTAAQWGKTIPEALDASLEKRLPNAVLAATQKMQRRDEQTAQQLSIGILCLGVAALLSLGAGGGWYAHNALQTQNAAAQVERLALVANQSAIQIEALTQRADVATESGLSALSPERRRDALAFANLGTADQRKTILAMGRAMDALNNARMFTGENVPVGCLANGPALEPRPEGVYRTCLVPLPPYSPKFSDAPLRQYYRQ